MTKFAERFYLTFESLIATPYYILVQRELQRFALKKDKPIQVLDIGGRRSPYTTGVRGEVTITDLPREDTVQHQLNLGLTSQMVEVLQKRRSNIKQVVFDDMTQTQLSGPYDAIVAVEVLEHVEQDNRFIQNVHRLLNPGGIFIMTTPNGHAVPNRNPDHKRHYRRDQLYNLLNRYFDEVDIRFAVRRGRIQFLAARSSRRFFWASPLILACRVISYRQSLAKSAKHQANNTNHLFAIAHGKRNPPLP